MMAWFDSRRVHLDHRQPYSSTEEVNILDHVYLVEHVSPYGDRMIRGVYADKSSAYRKVANCVRTIECHAGNEDEHQFRVNKREIKRIRS